MRKSQRERAKEEEEEGRIYGRSTKSRMKEKPAEGDRETSNRHVRSEEPFSQCENRETSFTHDRGDVNK